MRHSFKLIARILVWVALNIAASAQLLPAQGPTTPAANSSITDPLGRDTPSGTVYGFLQEVQSGNYANAAQYLQLSNAKRLTEGKDLSTQLKAVMDRAYSGNLRRISNLPEGTPQEGISPDRQRIGLLSAGDEEANLDLVRVSDPNGTRIWLISADTLAKVPELFDQLEVHQVETRLPHFLVRHSFLGMPLWQWLASLLALPVAVGLGWLTVWILGLLRAWRRGSTPPTRTSAWSAVSRPVWLLTAIAIHGFITRYLVLPLLPRHYYQLTTGVLFIIVTSWLLWRVLQQVTRRLRQHAIYTGRTGAGSVMMLGERILKALIFVVAVFVILHSLGFNMTTALAGLGIGGIAVAFAAQKTLENLFGGISVLGDEVIHVGDLCRFGDREGTVEDISLRSTRIRTIERTELYIPNGSLATMNVENLTRRDKMLFRTNIGLRCETSADQLRYVLAHVRKLLYEHPKVETDGARIRFIGIDESALTLELFGYILTRNTPEFLAIREDLLLRIMDLVDASGTTFAFPSRTLYLRRDPGLDKEKTEATAGQVQQWRENRTLPFPDYASSDISEFSNSLPYPQPDSALRSKK